MSNENNNNKAKHLNIFALPTFIVTSLCLLISCGYLYITDKLDFNHKFEEIKQERVAKLKQIQDDLGNIAGYLHEYGHEGSPSDSLNLAREYLKEKNYTASIVIVDSSYPYASTVERSNWATAGFPKGDKTILLSIEVPQQHHELGILSQTTVDSNIDNLSSYQLFDLHQTNYDVYGEINWLLVAWLALASIIIGLVSGTIFKYAARCKYLTQNAGQLPQVQQKLDEYERKLAQSQQKTDNLNLWYKAHVYELQSTFDGIKQMGGTLNTLWQALNMNLYELEPQYKKLMDEASDIIDNLSHGFVLPSYHEQETSVDECLKKILDGKQEEMRLGKLKLEFNAPEEAMLIMCRPSALKQIFHGLVHYAIRLTPEDCTIKVRFHKDSVEIEHFGFVLKSNDYSYRNSFLSLNLTALSYLCKKHNWSLVHKLSGPKGKQGGIFLLRFHQDIKPAIKLVHSAGN